MRLALYPDLNPAMRSARWNQVPFWLWGLLAIVFCASLGSFLRWAPWESALSPQDAIRLYPELTVQINPAWRAVTIQHGHVYEWPLGTIQQNPEGYRNTTIFLMVSTVISIGVAFAAITKASVGHALREKALNVPAAERHRP